MCIRDRGFPMRDATDRIRTIFALDRLSDAPYTDWEICLLYTS